MDLYRGAVFHHGGVPENRPLRLKGRFPSLMGRFPILMGRFPECLNRGLFKGGNGRRGISHPGERYNVCPRWCRDTRTVTRVRHHLLRDSTRAARRVQSVTVPSSRVSRECRSPGLRSPPFKNARLKGCFPSRKSPGKQPIINLRKGH